MPVIDRLATCGQRKWDSYDCRVFCFITFIALTTIALISVGLLARRGVFPKLKWKALVGSGGAMPFIGACLFSCVKEVDQIRPEQKPNLLTGQRKPEASKEAKKPHNLYKEHGPWVSMAKNDKSRLYMPIIPKTEDPYYDRLKPGDQMLVHFEDDLETQLEQSYVFGRTVVVKKQNDSECPYSLIMLREDEIDSFQIIIDGKVIEDRKALEEALKEDTNDQ